MKKIAYFLLSFLLVSQICSVQLYQQNRESSSNIKKSQLDQQDKHLPIIDWKIRGKSSQEFSTSNIPDKFRIRNDKFELNDESYTFLNDRFYANGNKTNFKRANKTLFPPLQIYVIDTAIVISTQDTSRHLYSFNASAKKTSDITQKLIGGIWVDYNMYTYTYDANNNMLTALYEYWDNGQLWGIRQTYTYDANNNMLTRLSEDWNSNNQEWVNQSRNTYAYDTNNNMLTALYEYFRDGQWAYSHRNIYNYDTNNNMLSSLVENYNYGQWVYSYRNIYTYDTNNNMLLELYEVWDYGQWVYGSRDTYTYDANKNMLLDLYEFMENGQWVFGYRFTYTYDVNNNMLTHLYEDWNNGQWWLRNRNTCTYNIQNNIISFWRHWWWESDSAWIPGDMNIRDSFSISDGGGNDYYFHECYNITLIYKLIVTEVESQNGELPLNYSLSQNYPNPFNPSTKLSYSIIQSGLVTLKVYDVLGTEMETLVNEEKPVGTYELNWNASNLPSGVYFYRLQAGSFVETKKMILIK